MNNYARGLGGTLQNYKIEPLQENLVPILMNQRIAKIFSKAINWTNVLSTDEMAQRRLEAIFDLLAIIEKYEDKLNRVKQVVNTGKATSSELSQLLFDFMVEDTPYGEP